MLEHPAANSPLGPDDLWAMDFFTSMLDERLSVEEFEAAISSRWQLQNFIVPAPRTAAWLHEVATQGTWSEAGYAHAAPELGFRSHFMLGVPGRPGAIYIEAPAETNACLGLQSLNRPLHQHDSGRIGVITSGSAIFHVLVEVEGDATMLDCVVEPGDVVFWPSWTPHTFNARDGFSLINAMANYVSPAADGFAFPVNGDISERPRRAYADYRAR